MNITKQFQLQAIKPKERDITKAIRDYLRVRNVFHWKVWQGLGSEKGVADILCLRKVTQHCPKCNYGPLVLPQFIAIEVKAPRGELSEYQRSWLDAFQNHGGIPIVARSVDDVIDAGL